MDATQKHRKIDIEALKVEAQSLIDRGAVPNGSEKDIIRLFSYMVRSDNPEVKETRIPQANSDTVVYQMPIKIGRADIVLFHIDGTASVIVVRDGTKGRRHVVSGIGHAGLYAAQLGMSGGALKLVRKCLLWTSTGSFIQDAVIEDVCTQANVIPIPWASLKTHLAVEQVTINRPIRKVA